MADLFSGLVSSISKEAASVEANLKQGTKDAVSAFFGSDYLRDFTHASKTFRDNQYSNAPKHKILFHVYFEINSQLLDSKTLSALGNKTNFGLAVKTIDLPKFTMQVSEMNQYNRKRYVQTKINYDPIRVAFHDDVGNMINRLWYAYYTYYYKDGWQDGTASDAHGKANLRNIYSDTKSTERDWGYIGETSGTTQSGSSKQKVPFFNSIKIYGINQQNFIEYRLINPIIDNFSHDTYDYSQAGGIMENSMSFKYEFVQYFKGTLKKTNGEKFDPESMIPGFGNSSNYDRTVSPITRAGSNNSIVGPGGLTDAYGSITDDLANGNILGVIQTAGRSVNTFKNPADLISAAKGDLTKQINNDLQNTPNRNNLFMFPSASSATTNAANSVNSALNGLFKPPLVKP